MVWWFQAAGGFFFARNKMAGTLEIRRLMNDKVFPGSPFFHLLFKHKKILAYVNVPVLEISAATECIVLDFHGFYGTIFPEHAFHLVKTYEAFAVV